MYPDIRLKMQMNSSVLYKPTLHPDHDLQEMYLDSFLKNAKLEGKDITDALHQLKDISEAYKINFVLSVSMDKEELPAEFQDDIIIAL